MPEHQLASTRDYFQLERGRVSILQHPWAPFGGSSNLLQLLEAYQRDILVPRDWHSLPMVDDDVPRSGSYLRLRARRQQSNAAWLGFAQYRDGAPYWGAGRTFTLFTDRRRAVGRVVGTRCSLWDPRRPVANRGRAERFADVSAEELARRLGLHGDAVESVVLEPGRQRRFVLPYDITRRDDNRGGNEDERFALPAAEWAPDDANGELVLAIEVCFNRDVQSWKHVPFRCFVDAGSRKLLRVQRLVSGCHGEVFPFDPVTMTGDTTITPRTELNNLRGLARKVSLPGMRPGQRSLENDWVRVVDFEPPRQSDFVYKVDDETSAFEAVNAFFHVSDLFGLVQELGLFDDVFGGMPLPVLVEARGESSVANAHAYPAGGDDPLPRLTFGRSGGRDSLGNAADRRIVMHEFGHLVMYGTIKHGELEFAHSIGDALAAILADPGSKLDGRARGETIPFTRLLRNGHRRHDYDPESGYAWGGSKEDTGYGGEQILSSTLFRLYRAAGGACEHPNEEVQRAVRWDAARRVVCLLLRTMASLPPHSVQPLHSPEELLDAMQLADRATNRSPDGLFLTKVARWAFERQGLFHPHRSIPAPPYVDGPGLPPPIDVYISEQRRTRDRGGYAYLEEYWREPEVWNRPAPDGNTEHEHEPAVEGPNFLYGNVRNRGGEDAVNVSVSLYVLPATMGGGLSHWTGMGIGVETSSSVVVGNGETSFGPLRWQGFEGDVSILAVADCEGDRANATARATEDEPPPDVPIARLVPADNNVALRSSATVRAEAGDPVEAFGVRTLRLVNPLEETANVELEYHTNPALTRMGCALICAEGSVHTIEAKESVSVHMVLESEPGRPPVAVRGRFQMSVHARVGGVAIGGYSYELVLGTPG